MNSSHQELPPEYLKLTHLSLHERIMAAKQQLGNKLVILGHHYQQDEVIQYADYRGDSLKLSQLAALERKAEFIVFCGVHFMAETADILSTPEQKVILPDLLAGCSMADMADLAQVEECWQTVQQKYGKELIPITYVNSTAEIKAFCGEHGGMTCTSSNAKQVISSALQANKQLLFLPDEHLGRNTALDLGVLPEEILLWDPESPDFTLPELVPKCILWNGFCSVHQKFTVGQVINARDKYPKIKVLVHPECSHEVVKASDLNGSTDYIIRTVSDSPVGSTWAVGTELNLVHRLAKENPDKTVVFLNETMCLCITMNRIDRPHLLWALENLVHGKVINQISVEPAVKEQAHLALQRMLELS